MLFDGAIAATTEQTTEAQTTTTQTTTMQTASADTSTQVDGSHVDGTTNHIDSSSSGTSTQTPASGNSEAVAVVGGPPHKEVVFVDMSVADYQTLVNQVPIGTEVVLLDSSKDGLTQMAAWAQTHSDYNAIHIISHGSEGRLYLGGMTLDSSNVASRQSDLIALSAALIPNGDILLYGCSVASGEGESFVSAIASTTGVDVAASSDLTGNLSKGGNWTLEKSVSTDGIQADALTFSHYNEMLTIVTFDNNDLNSNSGIYNKTVSSVGFTFTGADGYSFANNYGTNYNVFPDAAGNGTGDATKVTIEVNSGYTFDLTSFGYYTTVTDTIRVTFTYANNTTVTGTLTATTNTNITLSDFSVFRDGSNNPLPVSANDVIKVVISSENGTGSYDFGTNNFDISDVKAISSTNATSTLTAGAASEATTFSTTVTSVANASSLLDFTITDTGASDGVATTINALYANVSGSATSSELSKMTFLLSGPDATNVVGTYDSNTGRVTFSGLNVSIADGSSETYTIKAYYNDNTSNHDITDHHTVILSINASNVTTGSGSSTFASSQANVTNDSGASIDVAATKLIYSQSPSTAVVSGINFTSQPVVIAVDDRGNIDTDFNGSVTLSENGSGSLTGTTQVIASNGIATFSGVKYTSANDADANFVLTAAAGSLVSVASASINPDVVATRLLFSTQPVPTTIQDGQSASFTTVPVVQAVDANGMVDQDYTTDIVLSVTDPNDSTVDGTVNSLTVTSGDHDASATTVTLTPSGGIATYTGLIIQYTNSGSINTLALRATSGLLPGINSSSITSTSNTDPVFSNLNGGATFTEKGSVVVMDNDVTVADTELNNQGNYNGASISIARNGGANNVDTFGNSGLLGGLTQGQNFTYNGLVVGTVTANSSGTLTLTFNSNATSPIVNAVLQSLTYANSSDDPPSSVTLNWTFNDGSLNSSGTNQAVLSITPVNDAPVISNTSVSKTVNEDSVQTFNPADFGFSDVDSGNTLQSITIVTAPTAGELFIDANNDGVRDSGDTLLGNGAVVSAANISKLTFRPSANANGAGYASFTWQVSDGTALSANTGTMTLNVTPVNDAPVISNTSVSKTVNEDSAQTFNPADFGFSDVDSGDTLQSITIVTAPAAGELFIDANNNGVRDSGDTLLGNGAVVSAADISKLTFRPSANANGAGYAAFTWQVSDGTALSANTGTMTLNVTPVNDAPVISNTSVSKTVNENSVQTFSSADFGFSDMDSSDTLQSITIVTAPAAGELFIDANNDGVRNSGDTLLGNGAVVSAADISKLTFRPSANANGAGYASFTWRVSDGTALSANTGTMTLNVTPVNDAPVISDTSVSKTVNENSVQTFSSADFGFSDVDSSDTLQSITIVTAPSAGELFIDANNDGVRDSGDTLLGNGAVVSAADISKLTFRPTANANGAGYASFTWRVSDGTALSANTGTMTLNVTPVNDAPVISNTSVSKTVNENSVQTFNAADFGFSDVDSSDTLQSITIVTAPTAGELFIDANNDGVRGVGDTLLVSGAVVSAADISKLTFRPTANANGAGYASFTWQVSDGTALSANTGTMTLNVTPVNDAPVISNTSISKTVNEDSAQTFSTADFGFSDVDSSDTLQSITIVTAPTAGELFIDANNDGVRGVGDTLLVSGAVVSAADINKLTFRPTANANGAGYASFTWQVSDGTALSANTGTMTLNVTPVNDAPTLSSGDPQFRISDGANGSRPVDSRVPTIQSQVAGTPPLNTWITSSSLGSFNAGHTAGSSSIMASIFTATSDGVSGEDATKSDVANIFRHSSSFSSHFESSLGSFPSFSKVPAQGGSSSLASVFSDIYLPSLTPMEVFTGGSWKDINLHAQGATELGPEQATTAFTPSFPRQLQHIGEAEGQRLSAIAQALFEQSQLQS